MDRLLELTSRAEASHFWFRGFRAFVTPLLERAAAGRQRLRLLDCGCGTGYNLRHFTRLGRWHGMDLAATGLALARPAQRPLVRADATRMPYVSSSFDIVASFDMLQCVPDDGRAAAEIARVLKPEGHFVGTVAALDMLHGDHSVIGGEVRRYTRGSLVRLLEGAGLEPVRVTYAFASTFPLMLAARTAERALRRVRPVSAWEIEVPPAPVNAVLSGLLAIEAAVLRRASMPVGSTLVFLAKKRAEI